MPRPYLFVSTAVLFAATTIGCGDSGDAGTASEGGGGSSQHGPGAGPGAGPGSGGNHGSGGTHGNGSGGGGDGGGSTSLPEDAKPEDISNPTTIIGKGSPDECTSAAVVAAVAKGGVIVFDCGPDPVTIEVDATAKVFNDASDKIVIDGGNKVTLSGGGARRILYQNTCDEAQHWTTAHCDNQPYPELALQNITFVGGFKAGTTGDDGGGAVYASGGRLKVIHASFFDNTCETLGSDVAGGAIRAFQQSEGKPIYVVDSTFGADDRPNSCANGGAIGSIGVSWTIFDSTFTGNEATGNGASMGNGGNGGAIYNDGNEMTLTVDGVSMTNNHANAGGGAIFFVSNNGTGDAVIKNSTLTDNPSDDFETQPGIYFKSAEGQMPDVSGSTIE